MCIRDPGFQAAMRCHAPPAWRAVRATAWGRPMGHYGLLVGVSCTAQPCSRRRTPWCCTLVRHALGPRQRIPGVRPGMHAAWAVHHSKLHSLAHPPHPANTGAWHIMRAAAARKRAAPVPAHTPNAGRAHMHRMAPARSHSLGAMCGCIKHGWVCPAHPPPKKASKCTLAKHGSHSTAPVAAYRHEVRPHARTPGAPCIAIRPGCRPCTPSYMVNQLYPIFFLSPVTRPIFTSRLAAQRRCITLQCTACTQLTVLAPATHMHTAKLWSFMVHGLAGMLCPL